jgi:uncharacterized protein (DUF58 family)
MFNENWVTLAFFAILLGLILRQDSLLSMFAAMLSVAGISWVWNRYALQRVDYRRSFSERRAFLGETISVTCEMDNRKWLPVSWLRLEDEVPLALTALDDEVQPTTKAETGILVGLMSLRWFEHVHWRQHFRCDKRGFYAFGPARLQSGDPFGLFGSFVLRAVQDWLIVYPEVKPVQGLALPPKEPFGDTRAMQRIFEDSSRTIGIRDYCSGDSFRRIHWQATARRQKLQVKVYEPTTSSQVVIFLNMATLPKFWQGTVPELLERAISVAASVASCATHERYQVGLLANGCWPESDQPLKVLPSCSSDQLTRILEALAAVSSLPTITIEDLLHAESARLPWGATLMVVTAAVSEELLAVIECLQRAGRRLVLVRLDYGALPFEVGGLVVQHVTDVGNAFSLETENGR